MKSLPIAPVPVTHFCSAYVPLDLFYADGAEMRFYIDGNSKITRENGTFAEPVPNAFSLPAASVEEAESDHPRKCCPSSTSICRASCYVKGLATHQRAVYAAYHENLRILETLELEGPAFMSYAAKALATWIRQNAPKGFRWHVSGDVMSRDHAAWIAEVCENAPEVPFWIYTRTFDAVGFLYAPNLAINLSADRENLDAARACAYAYGARICYLCDDGHVPDLPPGSVIFPDYALRGRDLDEPTEAPWWQSLTHEQRKMVCGTDFFGQSDEHRCGPCRKCF